MRKKADKLLKEKGSSTTKTKKMVSNSHGKLEPKKYLTELTPNQARKAFEIRLGMNDIKVNYKGKYKESTCFRICQNEEGTLHHIFKCKSCRDILQLLSGFTPDWVHQSGTEKIQIVTQQVTEIETFREKHTH